MTIKEIKAMFQPGEKWTANNTWMPKANGNREVVRVLTTQMVWTTETFGGNFWMQFPKASQVLEARPGFLKFQLFSLEDIEKYPPRPGETRSRADAVVTLEKL